MPDDLYTIRMPLSLNEEYREVKVYSTLPYWSHIKPEFKDSPEVINTKDQFRAAKAVKDQVAGRRKADGTLAFFDKKSYNHFTRPGGIVILLESPHKGEYDDKFKRIAPLQSRELFKDHLAEVLKEVARHGADIPHGDITLCNPVRYQASLHRLIKNPRTKVDGKFKTPLSQSQLDAIRDLIWEELFRVDIVHRDFISRLCSYQPRLVINCVTDKLKGHVQEVLRHLVVQGCLNCDIAVASHPAAWIPNGPFLRSVRVMGRVSTPKR